MKTIDEKNIIQLTQTFGDSFYILDTDVFISNYNELLKAFKAYYPKTNIAYSYKTNYIPKLIKTVNDLGGFAEVVSEMELDLALKINMPKSKIVWNGPIKNKNRLLPFLLEGGTVNVDSLSELQYIKNNLRESDNVNIGLRCNFDVGDGVVSRFGFDVDGCDFLEALTIIKSTPNMNLIALQVHFARRDPKYWSKRAQGIIDIYRKIEEKYELHPKCIDLGGGMSGKIPETLRNQLKLDDIKYDDYASQAAKLFAKTFKDDKNAPWLFIEPGTAIAASSMRYVCKVEAIKKIRNKTIITTNGSQKNISMSGINPPMSVIRLSKDSKEYHDADIAGYTCIESDYLFKGYTGEIGVGDYLIFESCGSYSVVMKPPFILPNVSVIDISGSNPELIKTAERFNNIFSTYIFD